ncbi:MAG: hypothetical protein V4517_08450 [Pseudomonadota bacterium]
MLHAALYLGLALAYCEAATHYLMKGNRRDATRYAVITILYGSIAFAVLNPHGAGVPMTPPAQQIVITA